jgi:hypothetical protein
VRVETELPGTPVHRAAREDPVERRLGREGAVEQRFVGGRLSGWDERLRTT